MTTTNLDKSDEEVLPRARKSAAATTIASLVVEDSDYHQIGVDYFIGNHPKVSVMLAWTYVLGTTLTIRAKVSHAGSTWEWAPSYDAPTAGVSPGRVMAITFAAATWTIGGGVARCPVELNLERWRHVQLWVSSNGATVLNPEAVAGTIALGTGD